MIKKKKLLMSFLALNTIITSYVSAVPQSEKLYENMKKNIEKEKSNKENYKFIEQLLNQKNKELKDLYLQSDYIVKSEYLEWQIFFSGLYEEYGKGRDNTSENAKYHTKVDGYYDKNGNYVFTSGVMGGVTGKPYKPLQEPKNINLGVNIPLKGITRDPLSLSLSGVTRPDFIPQFSIPEAPIKEVTVNVDVDSFTINEPDITIPNVPTIIPINVVVPDTPNGDDSFNSLGNTSSSDQVSYVGNYNFSEGVLSGVWDSEYLASYSYSGLTGTSNWRPGTGSNVMSGAGSNGTINVTDYKPALYEITGADTVTFGENFKIKITSNLANTYNGMLPHLIQYDPHGTRSTYTPYQTDYYGNQITTPLSRWDRYGELVNKGTIEGEGNALLMIGLQLHGGDFSPTVKNEGTIIGLFKDGLYGSGGEKHVAFSFIAVRNGNNNEDRRLEFYNRSSGIIEMQAKNSIALNYGNKGKGRLSVYNEGKIVLYGNGSYGIKTSQSGGDLSESKIVLKTPITINGDSSIGVELARVMDDGYNTAGNPNPLSDGYDKQAAEIRVTIGDEKNRHAGNATGTNSAGNSYDKNYVEDSIGLYVNHQLLDYRLKEYEFLFGEYAKNSVLVYIDQGILTLDNIKYDTINIDKGTNNVGIVVDGTKGTKSELNLYPHIKVGLNSPVDGTTALVAKKGGKINLLGSNDIETNGKKSHGVVLSGTNTTLTGTAGGDHSIKVTGDNSASVYVDQGTVNLETSNNVNIYATGDKSVGIYNTGGTVNLGTTGGTYVIGSNGVLLYNNGGTINTAGKNFTVGDASIFSMADNSGRTNFNSNSTLNLLSGATGFIVNGVPSTYFSTHYSGLNNMDVFLTQGSTLVALKNSNSFLSSLSFDTLTQNFKSVTLNGGDIASLLEGTLNVDQNVNLDSSADSYNLIKKSLVGITVDFGITMSGSQDDQVGLAGNFSSVTSVTYNNMENNGTVNLTGKNSVAIYANNGNITNNNSILATGKNSFGIYGENGTTAKNLGNITVGDQGIGIYGVSHQNPSNTGTYGGGKINIINTGTITGSGGSGTIGIYSNLNKTSGLKSESNIFLTGGTINLENVTEAVGVYVNKGTITDAGSTITVGENGVGIYAKDSDLTLNNTNINLHGDNAVGLYLEGNTNLLAGNGNIDVNGQNVVLFNIVTDLGTTINNNFTVTSSADSSYTIGNISNGNFKYTGTSSLSSNGTFVSGKKSAVLLDTGSEIKVKSGSTGVAAMALDGQGASVPSGMRSGFDGENKGKITLEDNSVGLYGKNGSRLSNLGTISVGNNSAALVSSGNGAKLENGSVITIGKNSQGMFLNGGDLITNSTSGIINSLSDNSIGIFAENVPTVDNFGTINLTGDRSIGIYAKGASAISNYSIIEVGNSSDMNNPSIGIYSDNTGHIITNAETIKSGTNSIGIYSNNGVVNQSGKLDIGNNGVGIYAVNSNVLLNTGSSFDMSTNGTTGAVGVYGIGATVTNSSNLNIGTNNYGFIMKNGSFVNSAGVNSKVDNNSVFLYSTEATTINNAGNLTMTGSNNVGYYTAKDTVSNTGGAFVTNNGNINGTSGNNNVGIYNYGGLVNNYGTVSVGGSDLLFKTNEAGDLELDVENSKYAVGIYGENSTIINYSGAIVSAGYGGFGIVSKGGTATNRGTITTNGDYSTGMYTEGGIITNENTINITGNNAIGMAGKGTGSQLVNRGIINITGNNAIGMYGNFGTIITNTGTINITGSGQAFVSADPDNSAHSIGTGESSINGIKDNEIKSTGDTHTLPKLINAGIIKTTGVLALDGIQVLIKPDPTTKKPSSDPDYDFELSGTSLIADHVKTSKPIVILPGFADGTNANVYKLENVIKATSGKYNFVSGSLLWTATPKATDTGSDVYMSRKAFTEFSDGLWFDEFGKAMENKYLSATGDGVKIYNKTGYIKTEEQFRHIMGSLAGNIYANINQRENDISRTFESSLEFIESSENNTKENIKINVIAGKGENKEETDGIVGYDYTTTGILALREVERTYKHKFGYSLGYLHTGFEFKDGNESEEWVDTIQLGIHNKYKTNNWVLKNDLMGRVSIHNIDRNLDWPSPLERSEINGTYETYSLTSDNKLGREFEVGKKSRIVPYAGLRAMYVMRPTFKESGLEKLEVEGNNAWSVKPRAGVELQTALPLGNTSWQFKGTLDFAYEYELADLNKRERTKLLAIEDTYHKLSKPEDEKGMFRTKASVGMEIKDKYGIFLTGEYLTGKDKEDDYRTGITLKAVF